MVRQPPSVESSRDRHRARYNVAVMRHRTRVASVAVLGLLAIAGLLLPHRTERTVSGASAPFAVFLPLTQWNEHDGQPLPTPPPTVPAPGSSPIEIVAQLGGMATDVTVAGGLAYVTQGSGLTVYDVRDPARPVPVGRAAPLGGVPQGVTLSGHHAFVATSGGVGEQVSQAGLAVVDVVDPAHPTLVWRLEYGGGLSDVVIGNEMAFVGPNEFSGLVALRALDISNPTRPRQVGQVSLSQPSRRLALQGSRIYSAEDVIEVADPKHMRLVEPFRPRGFPSQPTDLVAANDRIGFVTGSLDFVSGTGSGYLRWLSPPAAAPVITTVDCPSGHEGLGIARLGERFLSVGVDGGCVFETQPDGTSPSAHSFEAPGRGTAVSVLGDVGYVATNLDWSEGPNGHNLPNGGALQTLDLTVPTAPKVSGISRGPTAFTPAAVGVSDRLYAIDGSNGQLSSHLWVMDASNPAAPITLGMAELDSLRPAALAVDGDLLYLADDAGLETWDVSDSTHPNRIGQRDVYWADHTRYMAKRGHFVYALSSDQFYTIDVTDPTSQVPVHEDEVRVRDFVAGPTNVGYWSTERGIQAVRLGAGPPEPIGALFDADADRLAVDGTTVFALERPVSSFPTSILILDASDPAALRQIGTIEKVDVHGFDSASAIVATDRRLYLVNAATVMAWDITRPSEPRAIDAINMPDYSRADGQWYSTLTLSAWGSRAVIAQVGGGVTVVEAALR
jgi:hypothetical protein